MFRFMWLFVLCLAAFILSTGCECSPGGTFNGGPNGECVPRTCAEMGRDCGEIDDGCGEVLFCGTCTSPEVCGGGGTPGVCGVPGGPCTPRTCAEIGDYCGPMPDGCGDFVTCVHCEPPEICGGEEPMRCGLPDPDSAGTCEPLSCEAQGIQCGLAGDGCGDTLDCGDCPPGQTCGGAGVPSQCDEPECIPLTCADQGIECGRAGDGCGGLTGVCGTCTPPETCGGGGLLGVCGHDESDPCQGRWCGHQAFCPQGQETSLTGTVYTPNGQIPIANAIVFVPNADLPPIRDGVECLRCEDQDMDEFFVVTVTDSDGSFELKHVPADVPFPLVVQIGKWRRVVEIPAVAPCSTTQLTAEQTRLPANRSEGHIPRIAVSTGAVDGMECVLYKAGVDESEFTRPSGNGRISLYRANGAWPDQSLMNQCGGGGDTPQREQDGQLCISDTPGNCPSACRPELAHNLYGNQSTLNSYDVVIFSCEQFVFPMHCCQIDGQIMGCDGTNHKYRDAADRNRVLNYVNAGGRVFLSHWSYDWLWNDYRIFHSSRCDAGQWIRGAQGMQSYSTVPLSSTCDWAGGDYGPTSWNRGTIDAFVETGFERGQVFSEWLGHVQASEPGGRVRIQEPRAHCGAEISPGLRWVYSERPTHARDSVQQLTFNTPVGASEDEICGRVAYSAFHVTTGESRNEYFPRHCQGAMTSQEKVLLFMLFDLAACLYDDESGGHPSMCVPLECDKIGAECGWLADGCGGEIDCGDCPPGQTCGGGGEPYRCGSPCMPIECGPDNPNECGYIPDGCGDAAYCGECPDGMFCRGGVGTPNYCVAGYCENLLTCEDWNASCGRYPDGCGGIIECGGCPEGMHCVPSGDPNVPGDGSAECREFG